MTEENDKLHSHTRQLSQAAQHKKGGCFFQKQTDEKTNNIINNDLAVFKINSIYNNYHYYCQSIVAGIQ